MTIRTKLILLSLLPMATVLAVAMLIAVMVRDLQVARASQHAATEIVRGVFEMNLLTAEYIQQPSERVREQFSQRDESLRALLDRLHYTNREQQHLLRSTRSRYDELTAAIIRLSSFDPESPQADDPVVRLQVEQLNRQVMTRSHALVSLASRQAALSTAQLMAMQTRAIVSIVALLVLMAVLVGGGAVLIARDIVAALLRLRSEFDIVGRGDLQYHIATERHDEIGQLARAFNAMNQRLRRITVSRDELQREIDERRQAEAKLQRMTNALKRSNQELEQFAYIASHDLQEPLGKVRAFGQLLREHLGEGLDAEGSDYLRRMLMTTQRMGDLIRGLLTYSQVSTKVMPFEQVDLNEIARQVVSDLELQTDKQDGEVRVHPLPTVHADPLQMRQLLQNLISNGLKFRHLDRPPLVEVYADEDASHWRLYVRDQGIGIDPDHYEQLFLPFRRLHGRGSPYAGTGIGLAICRKIAERHGGTIRVESAADQGATFIVELPRTPPQPQPAEAL